MSAVASLRTALARPSTSKVRLAVRRTQAAVPASRRLWTSPRAEEAAKSDAPAPAAAAASEPKAVAAPARAGSMGLLSPSFSRMSQMMHEMEREMEAMSRAFGMPMPSLGMPASLGGWLDEALPAAAPSALPAMAKSLAVDIKDSGSEICIHADVPGMGKDDIQVQVSPDRVLTISGERRSEQREGSEEAGSLRVERSYGQFLRRFKLPDNVDVEGIKAVTKDGELRLTIPKTQAEEPQAKQIPVDAE